MNDNLNGDNGDQLAHDDMGESSPDQRDMADNDEIEYDEMDLTPYEEDDDQTLHKKLCAAKVARKRAEEDLKLLCNRIGLLKMEENKVSVPFLFNSQIQNAQLRSNFVLSFNKLGREKDR